MNKQEFLARLREGLSGLPKDDIDERVTFYGEMIDDRAEDGIPEEAAVEGIGDVEALVSQLRAELSLTKPVEETKEPKRKPWQTALIVLGTPIWLSLLIAAFAVVFSVYIALWATVIALWAAFAALAVCAPACLAAGVNFAVSGNTPTGIALIAAGIVCAGLSVFMFFGCKAASKGILKLTKQHGIRVRIRKETAQ